MSDLDGIDLEVYEAVQSVGIDATLVTFPSAINDVANSIVSPGAEVLYATKVSPPTIDHDYRDPGTAVTRDAMAVILPKYGFPAVPKRTTENLNLLDVLGARRRILRVDEYPAACGWKLYLES